MKFTTKKVTTKEWLSKLAFYAIIGRETPTGEIVDTIDFIGEFTKEEILEQITQENTRLTELEERLLAFGK